MKQEDKVNRITLGLNKALSKIRSSTPMKAIVGVECSDRFSSRKALRGSVAGLAVMLVLLGATAPVSAKKANSTDQIISVPSKGALEMWKDWMAVGHINSQVRLFKRNAAAQMELVQILGSPEPQYGGYSTGFGSRDGSVAFSGGYMLIGANGLGNSAGVRTGAAYLYKLNRSAQIWEYIGKISNPNGSSFDLFGSAVDIDYNYKTGLLRMVVGAHGVNEPSNHAGAAYMFHYDANTQSFASGTRIFPADGGGAEYWFGYQVAINSRSVVVSAPYANSERGAIYIGKAADPDQLPIRHNGDHKWTRFGVAMDISDEILAVGTPRAFALSNGVRTGVVDVFNANRWADPPTQLQPLGGFIPNDHFGESVDVFNDEVLTSSYAHDVDGTNWVGVGHYFEQIGNANWVETRTLTPDTYYPYYSFGWRAAMAPTTVRSFAFSAAGQTGVHYIAE